MKAELAPDAEPGLKLAAAAVEKMQSAKDALPALLPIGLGERSISALPNGRFRTL